jgi:hypothetical protein
VAPAFRAIFRPSPYREALVTAAYGIAIFTMVAWA